MTSKWIMDIRYINVDKDRVDDWTRWQKTLVVLERIDRLLRRAMAETDSETLLDSLEHEIYNEINKKAGIYKRVTGTSKLELWNPDNTTKEELDGN